MIETGIIMVRTSSRVKIGAFLSLRAKSFLLIIPFFSGANIQGKGREYNLQRHKSNYCAVRKAAKQNERASMPISTLPSTDSGSSGSNPNSNGNHHPSNDKNTSAFPSQNGSAMSNAPMATVGQVYGPVPATASLPLGRGMEESSGNGQGVEV
jgi:hypothetical protein